MTFRDALELTGVAAAALVSVAALAGMVAQFVLLPWLRSRLGVLTEKVTETHRQVTVNGHTSPTPTVRDRLDELKNQLHVIAVMYEEHMRWSDSEVTRLWDAIERDRRRHERDDR